MSNSPDRRMANRIERVRSLPLAIRYSRPLVPATRWRPGHDLGPAPTRGGRSADRRTGASAPVGPAHDAAGQALARRLASLSGGTRASRRSTLAIFGFGSALPSPALPPEMRAASSSQH